MLMNRRQVKRADARARNRYQERILRRGFDTFHGHVVFKAERTRTNEWVVDEHRRRVLRKGIDRWG